MKTSATEETTVAEQAQAWIEAGAQAQDPQAFAAWLKRSPRHVQSYLEMLAVEREFRGMDAQRSIDVEALIAAAQSNVVPLAGLRFAHTPQRARRFFKWAASVAVLMTTGVLLWITFDNAQVYQTDTGQQQKIKLADGSLIELNTQSRVHTRYAADSRDVYLLAGEALFDVRHDAARPFRVHVGDVVIEDLGTQFNVYRRDSVTTVSVIEGEVTVANGSARPTPLKAGEAVQIQKRGQVAVRQLTDAAHATAWRQRRLWFQGETLGKIAEEFNRYNIAPKIIINDASLRERRFSGIFNADDPKSFVQFLYQDAGLDFDYESRGLVVRAR